MRRSLRSRPPVFPWLWGMMLLLSWAVAAPAQTTFIGPGTNWILAQHWSAGVPDASTNTYINSGNVYLGLSDGSNPYYTGAEFDINAGSLTLSANGRLQSRHVNIAGVGQTASVMLSDSGASWTVTEDLGVGTSGFGQLTLKESAKLYLGRDLYLSYAAGSTGVLNIGDFSGSSTGGSITFLDPARKLIFGNGNGTLNFNQTNTFVLGAPLASASPGKGSIVQRGTGTTYLAGDNSGFSGTTEVLAGTLVISGVIGTSVIGTEAGGTVELNAGGSTSTVVSNTANTILSGAGTVRKTGEGTLQWGAGAAQFALGSGGRIDVQEGRFIGGSNGNENWTNNLSDLNVAAGATFEGVEAVVRVDALTGAGTIKSGYHNGTTSVGSFTFGVDNGTGTFAGNLADGTGTTTFFKTGTGTQTLTGTSTFASALEVHGGSLVIAGGGKLQSGHVNIGTSVGHSGSATVSGAGSSWTTTDDLGIGVGGTGQFTLKDGAQLKVGNYGVFLGYSAGGTGALNIGDFSGNSAAGTLTLTGADGKILFGAGAGVLNLNQNNLFVLAAPLVSQVLGRGSVVQRGTGTTFLAGDMSGFTGTTEVLAGRLVASGATGSKVLTIESGGVLELVVNGQVVSNFTNTVVSGTGTLRKTGDGTLGWGTGAATFVLGTGGLLDIQEGAFIGGANGNENWSNNRGDLSVAAGATFSGVEANVRVDALSGGGRINSGYTGNVGSFTFGVDNGSGTFGGVLADGTGVGRFIKEGSGTQILAGANTYTGGTAVNGGMLVFDSAQNQWLTGGLTGSGALRKQGGGTLALGNATDFTGMIEIDAGKLALQGGSKATVIALPDYDDNVRDAVLEFDTGAGDYVSTARLEGTGTVVKRGSGSLTFHVTADPLVATRLQTGYLYLDPFSLIDVQEGTLKAREARDSTYNIFSNLWEGNVADLRVAAGATFDFAGTGIRPQIGSLLGEGTIVGSGDHSSLVVIGSFDGAIFNGTITGSAGLEKHASNGRQTLAGNNTYTGTTAVKGGELVLTGDTKSAVFDIAAGAKLTLGTAANRTYSAATRFTGGGTLQKAGAGTLASTAPTTFALGSGSLIEVQAGAMVRGTAADVIEDFLYEYSPQGSGGIGGVQVSRINGAMFIPADAPPPYGAEWDPVFGSAYRVNRLIPGSSGPVDIKGGILDRGMGGGENWIENKADLQVAAGASFHGNAANVRVDALSGGGTITSGHFRYTYDSAGWLVDETEAIGGVPNYGSFTFGVDNGSGTFSGTLADTGNLMSGEFGYYIKEGTGTQVLTGINTFVGGLTVKGGLVQVNADTGLGHEEAILTLNGGGIKYGAAFDNLRGFRMGAAGAVLDTNGFNVTYGDNISTEGGGVLTKAGTGVLRLTGSDFNLSGAIISGGALQLDRPGNFSADIQNNAALIFNAGGDTTFNRVVSGSGSVTKQGGGTLTLAKANTYTGGTTISEGTLRVGNGATTGSIAGNILVNATLTFDRSDAMAYAGELSGAGNLVKQGAGALTLTGDSSFTGGVALNAGTLQIGAGGTTGSLAGAAIENNTSVVFNRSDTVTHHGVISGTGSLVKEGAGTLVLTNFNTFSGGTTISGGTLQVGNGGIGAVLLGNVANNATFAFQNTSSMYLGGVISGTGKVVQRGSGIIELAGNNTFTGGLVLESGTLMATTDANLGTAGGAVQFGGGTLTARGSFSATRATALGTGGGTFDTGDGTVAWNGVISGGGTLTKQGGGTLILGARNTATGALAVNGGTLVLQRASDGSGAAIASGATLELNPQADDSAFFTQPFTLSGAGTLRKTGAGTVVAPYATVYSMDLGGVIDIQAGTWREEAGNWNANRADLAIAAGAFFDSPAGTVRVNRLRGAGGIRMGSLAYSLLIVGYGNGSDTFDGTMTGVSYLGKIGSGTQVFTGDIGASDGLNISSGTVQIGNGGTTGSFSGGIYVASGASVAFNRSDQLIHGGVIDGPGTVTKQGGGVLLLTGANTFSGGLVVRGGSLAVTSDASLGAASGAITLDGGRLVTVGNFTANRATTLGAGGGEFGVAEFTTLTWAGDITGSGDLVKHDLGTLLLTGNNSYTGITAVDVGTLRLGSATALSPHTTLAIAPGATFDANGYVQTVGGLSGSGGLDVGTAGLTVAATGSSTYAGGLTGMGGLTKSGEGVLNLTGASTYTGATIISDGTLLANNTTGSAFGFGTVVVQAGGTLGGAGFIGAPTTVESGGVLAPGNSPGTLTFASGLVLEAGSMLDFQLGTISDRILVTGGVLEGPASLGSITLNLANAGGFTAGTYTLFDFTGATLSNFDVADFSFGTTIPGYDFALALNANTLNLTANFTPVPEPSTYVLLALGAGLAWVGQKRRALALCGPRRRK